MMITTRFPQFHIVVGLEWSNPFNTSTKNLSLRPLYNQCDPQCNRGNSETMATVTSIGFYPTASSISPCCWSRGIPRKQATRVK